MSAVFDMRNLNYLNINYTNVYSTGALIFLNEILLRSSFTNRWCQQVINIHTIINKQGIVI